MVVLDLFSEEVDATETMLKCAAARFGFNPKRVAGDVAYPAQHSQPRPSASWISVSFNYPELSNKR